MSDNRVFRLSALAIGAGGASAALAGCGSSDGGDNGFVDRYFDICPEIPYLNKEAE